MMMMIIIITFNILLYCSECEQQLDQQRAELSRMRTYLAESESLSQSTDMLRKEIVELKDQIAVGTFRCYCQPVAIPISVCQHREGKSCVVTCCLAGSDTNASVYCAKHGCNFRPTLFQDELSDLNRCDQHLNSGDVQLTKCDTRPLLKSVHDETNVHRVSKNKQNYFCYNFIKFSPTLTIFGTNMAERLKLYEVHSFSTSPNSCHHTTMLNADVPNCYKLPSLCQKLSELVKI